MVNMKLNSLDLCIYILIRNELIFLMFHIFMDEIK